MTDLNLSLNIGNFAPSQPGANAAPKTLKRNDTKERFKQKIKDTRKGIVPEPRVRKTEYASTSARHDATENDSGAATSHNNAYNAPTEHAADGMNERSKKIGKDRPEFSRGEDRNHDKPAYNNVNQRQRRPKPTPAVYEKPPVPTKDFAEILGVDENKLQEGDVFTTDKFDLVSQLHPHLVSALKKSGYETMTRIQRSSIPVLLKRKDSIIKSETGSGKTLAYLVPIINTLVNMPQKIDRTDGTYVLVLCPTRELCLQVLNTATNLLRAFVYIVPGAIMGGESIKREKARLRKGMTLLITTPGRLLYHLHATNSFKYDKLTHLVFEESDRTLDLGFKKDLEFIIDFFGKKNDFEKIQKILISASFTEKIESLWLKISPKECVPIGFDMPKAEEPFDPEADPQAVKLEYLEYDNEFKLPAKLSHKYIVIDESKRISFLVSMVMFSMNTKVMIFVATCDQVDFLEILFTQLCYDEADEEVPKKLIPNQVFKLHGKVDQKKRTEAYFGFKKSKNGILICTDVGSRGLDFEEVRLIIQYDIPSTVVDYVNRMGRTARIDNYGMSLLFLCPSEKEYLGVLKEKGIVVEKYQDEDFYSYFEGKLKNERNVHIDAHSYIERIVRKLIRESDDYKTKARRTYVSFIRAYARLLPKEIFHPKKLNLHAISKSLGLGSSIATTKETKSVQYNNALTPENINRKYAKLLEKRGERRKITAPRILERMEFEA